VAQQHLLWIFQQRRRSNRVFSVPPTAVNDNNWQQLTPWTLPTLTYDQLVDAFLAQLGAALAALQNEKSVTQEQIDAFQNNALDQLAEGQPLPDRGQLSLPQHFYGHKGRASRLRFRLRPRLPAKEVRPGKPRYTGFQP